ncbi:MAG: hypothetical protein QOI01_1945 [Mycobacterium sp.]|jgi:hypothetical protein|nr:hypothetical protein [Mycobacterium sp.]
MGRHSAATTHWTLATARVATSGGAARYVGRVGALAVALGVGAAVAGGGGIARADDTTHDSPGDTHSVQSSPDTNVTAGPSDTVGKDPQSHGSPSWTPGVRKAALRVPRMVLGANGGARTTTPRPGGIRVKTPAIRAGGPGTTAARAPVGRNLPDPGAVAKPLAAVTTQVDDQVRTVVRDIAATPRHATQTSPPTTDLAPQLAVSPHPAPIATTVSKLLTSVAVTTGARTDDAPLTPVQSLLGVLGLISRDIEQSLNNAVHQTSPTTTTQTTPGPGDVVDTPYGRVGKWMLTSDGEQVANWGGQIYGDKTLREPVNVIIVDPNSKTPGESTARLNSAMFWSGFPAQPIHSTGFDGTVLGTTYDQLPGDGTEAAYSDLPFFLPNDHARVFGPAPVAAADGTGYLWTAAASTEVPGIYDNQFTHRYLSYDLARDMLALRLILSGQATFVGVQKMDNVYNEGTVSTGDHDGYAIVLRLN